MMSNFERWAPAVVFLSTIIFLKFLTFHLNNHLKAKGKPETLFSSGLLIISIISLTFFMIFQKNIAYLFIFLILYIGSFISRLYKRT